MANMNEEMLIRNILGHLNHALPGAWEHVEGNVFTLPLVSCWVATEIEVLGTYQNGQQRKWHANILNGGSELFSYVADSEYEAVQGIRPYLDILMEMDSRVQKVKETRVIALKDNERVETGRVKFIQGDGDTDWAGIFIRGDAALYYALILDYLLENLSQQDGETAPPMIYVWQMRSLLRLLASCYEN